MNAFKFTWFLVRVVLYLLAFYLVGMIIGSAIAIGIVMNVL